MKYLKSYSLARGFVLGRVWARVAVALPERTRTIGRTAIQDSDSAFSGGTCEILDDGKEGEAMKITQSVE